LHSENSNAIFLAMDTDSTEAITRAVKAAGGQSALAQRAGISPGMIWQLVHGHRPIPPKLAVRIEKAIAGAVSRADLRPDIFGGGDEDEVDQALNPSGEVCIAYTSEAYTAIRGINGNE
jgi:transcriptional regulator with XRE-family HTH domain